MKPTGNKPTYINRRKQCCFQLPRTKRGYKIRLQVTTDAIGLYLYLIKALSDDRRQLLEDNIRFTGFIARYIQNIPQSTDLSI